MKHVDEELEKMRDKGSERRWTIRQVNTRYEPWNLVLDGASVPVEGESLVEARALQAAEKRARALGRREIELCVELSQAQARAETAEGERDALKRGGKTLGEVLTRERARRKTVEDKLEAVREAMIRVAAKNPNHPETPDLLKMIDLLSD